MALSDRNVSQIICVLIIVASVICVAIFYNYDADTCHKSMQLCGISGIVLGFAALAFVSFRKKDSH